MDWKLFSPLEQEIIKLIIETCNLEDLQQEITPDTPLIGENSPFGLDSLDAIEIVVAIQKRFGIRIANQDTTREVLRNIRSLANFIEKNHKVTSIQK